MSRFAEFLTYMNETAIAKAIKISDPDESKEYDESEVTKNMSTLISAVKALKNKTNMQDIDKDVLADYLSKLRQWLKVYNDRFSGSDIAKAAELVLPAGKPKKVTAPVDPMGAMDIKLAAKTGALAPDPEVIKMLDAKDQKEKEKEEELRDKQEKEQDKASSKKNKKSKKEKK